VAKKQEYIATGVGGYATFLVRNGLIVYGWL